MRISNFLLWQIAYTESTLPSGSGPIFAVSTCWRRLRISSTTGVPPALRLRRPAGPIRVRGEVANNPGIQANLDFYNHVPCRLA